MKPPLTKKNSPAEIKTSLQKSLKTLKVVREELAYKNRELEIESSLERVRAVAMRMTRPDDMLLVCRIISEQLAILGVKEIRNVQTAIFYVSRGTYMNYEYYAKHKKTFVTETVYTNHKIAKAFAAKMLKGKGETSITLIKGKKVKDWLAYQKSTNVFIDRFLEKASSLNYYWHSLGPVALGISTYVPLKNDELKLFQRFMKVFELAYTRYLDIEQAIAQAREAQIQLAMERVRARTMAMQRSDELAEAASLLFKQVSELGVNAFSSGFNIWKTDGKSCIINMCLPDGSIGTSYHLPHTEYIFFKNIYEARQRGDDFIVMETGGKELEETYKYMFSLSEANKSLGRVEDIGFQIPKFQVNHCAFFSQGYLMFITYESVPEMWDVFKRFAKVFEQTYTRFLDLQKAEAQARESQIQLALERVRARSMSMHHSDELTEVLTVLFEQFDVLGIYPSHAQLSLFDVESNTFSYRLTGKAGQRVIAEQILALDAMNMWNETVEKWKKGDPDIVQCQEYPKEILPALFELFSEIRNAIPENARPYPEDFPDGLYITEGYCKFGYLGFGQNRRATEEEKEIVKRFANEFGRLYQRFLDLQKSEAQAREAQIELGLERVRARAMAMQKSDELSELVDTVFKELTKLDFALTWCIINIIDESSMSNTVWAANPDINKAPESYHMLFEDYPFHHAMMKGWKERKTKYVYVLGGSEKKIYDDYLFSETEFKRTPEAAQVASKAMEKYVVSFSFSNFGGLQTVGDLPLSEANLEILSRFGKVFDLTYTRFNDLQKAETQAREAQIELGLERVRARAMAMQKSEDLNSVVLIVFQELGKLNQGVLRCGIGIFNKEKRTGNVWSTSLSNQGTTLQVSGDESFDIHPLLQGTFACWLEQKDFSYTLEGEDLVEYYKAIAKTNFNLPESKSSALETKQSKQYYYTPTFQAGNLYAFCETSFSDEAKKIMNRFSVVLNLTYNRFVDLQKAEAQAREAQIEAALERVRSRTMAMQKSDELKEVIQTVYDQFIHLKINIEHTGFILDYKERDDMYIWLADRHEVPAQVTIPYFDCSHWNSFNEAKEKGNDFFANRLDFEEKNKFYQDLFEFIPGVPEETLEYYFSCPGVAVSTVLLENVALYIENFDGIPYTDEENNTLMRFGKVFQQTYTRFLDLQKAEAQAREAQIETALERVRGKAMAMHHSDELSDVLAVLFEQFDVLNIRPVDVHLDLFDLERNTFSYRATGKEGKRVIAEQIVYIDSRPEWQSLLERWKKGKPNSIGLSYYPKEVISELMDFFPDIWAAMPAEAIMSPEDFPDGIYDALGYCKFGYLGFHHFRKTTEEENRILVRFANEFERLYQRFLDLQKAEAQAREAQIQLAMERVRARTMAMQRSEELADVATVLFQQVKALGVPQWTCGFSIFEIDDKEFTWYPGGPGGEILPPSKIPLTEHPVFISFNESRKRGDELFVYEKTGELQADHYRYMASIPGTGKYLQDRLDAGFQFPTFQIDHIANFSHGNLAFITYEPFPEMHDVFKRFAKVFEQTYTRFLDLEKAEAQAREAKIEAALERVRSRTLAMHKSDELAQTAVVVFQQLISLGIEPNRLYIGIIKDESGDMEMWATDEDGTKVGTKFMFNKNENASVKKLYDGWAAKEKFVVVDMQGKELEDYFHYLNHVLHIPFKGGLTQKRRVQSVAYFSKGFIGMASPDEQNEESLQLLERFAAVFNLTYTRFNDLQVAEAQTHKANIEVALERVRARALAMQQPEELIEVAEVLRHEMGLLGVEELETCSIYINDEATNRTECWYALKDLRSEEKKLVSDHFPLNLKDTWVGREMEQFYKSGAKQVSIIMQGANRKEWINYCEEKSVPLRAYYGEVIPDRTYHLYKFSHGAIGAASAGDISHESWELLSRAASVFSLAYSRFKDLTQSRIDLQRLKEEKQRAEEALTELQVTQTQLIQSEKMASLGELTAGIAHEIQNPLNFVNNFSEVSIELLSEMEDAMLKSDREEILAISNDIKQNLEKINHHGKRADAIVKGMLQHSRSSSGVKEPTNINALADEYLRLAYHGLRAKDKSFNATMKTDFDETIGNINIIPQDIGRVILNLITNAFYVVDEKKKSGIGNYEPIVSVSTKKIDDKILITVKDNGNGIPQKVLDKIFQPFFTTKPTGQGTGLGLSLSYDIVKAHGGELKVETKEARPDDPVGRGEGSEFIIQLPVV